MKNSLLILALSLTLSACGTSSVQRERNGNYTVTYEHGAVNSVGLGVEELNEAALNACKSGKWEIVKEIHSHDSSSPYGATQWEIKCL